MRKMKKSIYLLLLITAVLQTACSKDEVEVFDSNNYIYFNVDAKDDEAYPSLSWTFTFMDASVKSDVYEIPVKFAGRYLDKDAMFEWKVVDSLTTAIAGAHYEEIAPEEQTIQADKSEGVLKIKLLRTADMQNKSYDLVLQLVANDNFQVGPVDEIKITITDQLVRPDWWVYTPYERFLGTYSLMKLRLWLEFMGVEDGSNPFESEQYVMWADYGTGNFIYKLYKDGEVKSTVLAFKNWLYVDKENPYDEDLKMPVAESLGSY